MQIYEELIKVKKSGEEAILITVVEKNGHGPASPGSKMLIRKEGNPIGTVGGGALEHAALTYARELLDSKQNNLVKYTLGSDNEILSDDAVKTGMICGGTITLFFEYIGPGEKLYIFGAGHIGKALAYHLRNLGYYITIIDNREGLVNSVENVQNRITVDYENVFKDEKLQSGGFFIIASHSHPLDYIILNRIYQLNCSPRYIGLIASRRKAPLMIDQLKNDLGNGIDLDILYTPIGLDIGGATPDEIAISIISELQAVRYHKTDHLHLKNKINYIAANSTNKETV